MRTIKDLFIHYLNEILLCILILLNIMDLAGLLGPDLDVLKKIISWTIVGYLLYKAGFSRVITGVSDKRIDCLLLIGYFLLSIRVLIGYAVRILSHLQQKGLGYWARVIPVTLGNTNISPAAQIHLPLLDLHTLTHIPVPAGLDLASVPTILSVLPFRINQVYVAVTGLDGTRTFLLEPRFFMHRWIVAITSHINWIEAASIALGILLLAIVSLRVIRRIPVQRRSFLGAIGEFPVRANDGLIRTIFHFLLVFFSLTFIYIAVASFFLEWVAFTIDAPLMFIGILFYVMIVIRHHKKFHVDTLLYRIGSFGERFYSHFIRLFHSRKGILVACAGILCLHLAVDIIVFLLPYLSHGQTLYVHGHVPSLWGSSSIFLGDLLRQPSVLMQAIVSYLHIANITALAMLLLLPGLVWLSAVHTHVFRMPWWLLSMLSASMIAMLVTPAFTLQPLQAAFSRGVLIFPRSVLQGSMPLLSFLLSLAGGILVIMMRRRKEDLLRVQRFVLAGSYLFFLSYIIIYALDLSSYYAQTIASMATTPYWFISVVLLIVFSLTLIFYSCGLIMMLLIYLHVKKLIPRHIL
ncbi:MAG: hypothetical protein ACOCWQ_03895 [Nanoarchaeota archaeon]